MEISLQNYYGGTSGLLLPVPNKAFYPKEFQQRPRLSYYSSLMNSIEINSTFYKIPGAGTVARWAEEVPEDFRFTFKLFKGITHSPGLRFDQSLLKTFMQVMVQAGSRKGCLLIQFPPSIRIEHLPQLEALSAAIREYDPLQEWATAIEFRHPSLYVEQVNELLKVYGLGRVIHDKGKASSPIDPITGNFTYLRFHGPDGDYRGSYTPALLDEYASYIVDWLLEGKKVFVYFNNTMGAALANLVSLRGFVQEHLAERAE